jgi:hypothetical protein
VARRVKSEPEIAKITGLVEIEQHGAGRAYAVLDDLRSRGRSYDLGVVLYMVGVRMRYDGARFWPLRVQP